ncbi:MAG: tRNA (adenosine(37)-N6)-threonylcarbamoyltransferase complex dimerization subunit type 1 TsaB [Nitrospirae bacterium]|nr:tRNA (adenosine(37)-N6)-threonylcarbamoyltransferase complex dimerization subunit type 1 TsaB [Nitrospirota bacterium]
MKVLAIETSTMTGGAAVMDDAQGIIMEVRFTVSEGHSERLMVEIDHCLKEVGITVSDMDALSVSIGPGSFTGLRIGLSTVKGFSYATGIPVVAVPTLEAFSWNFPMSPYPVCPLLDARKKEVYAGVFLWNKDGFCRALSETSIKIRELTDLLKEHERVMFAGQGALLYKKEILEALGDRAIFPPPHLNVPLASATAYLGMKKALCGQFDNPLTLSPFYLRKAEAELKLMS